MIKSPIPLILAGIASLAALPFKGYRLICAGFFGVIALIALVLVVVCGSMFRYH